MTTPPDRSSEHVNFPVLVEIAVGDSTDPLAPGVSALSLAEAAVVATAAAAAGVAALRILDRTEDEVTLEPILTSAFLAGRSTAIGFLPDASTSHNAPYNLARRVLSTDRATAGAVGVVLRAGEGDEVTDPVATVTEATSATRWSEYAGVLTRLWESFPAAALLGDQERELVVDRSLITSIDHVGAHYRVAGPLDGPSSVQGRPMVAGVAGEVDWLDLAEHADVVIADPEHARVASAALTDALAAVGRPRHELSLVGRVPVTVTSADEGASVAFSIRTRAEAQGLDAVLLVPTGGIDGTLLAIDHLVPHVAPHLRPATTLREGLGLAREATPLSQRQKGNVA